MRMPVLEGEDGGTTDPAPMVLERHTLPAVEASPEERALSPDRHPAAVYLARLAPGSRRSQRAALETIARTFDPAATVEGFPWHRLRYQHTQAVRAVLAARYGPATCNRVLAALRQVVHESRRLGLVSAEDATAAADVPNVRGSRLPRGRALSPGELRALFAACDVATPTGTRNAALLAVLYAGGLRRAEVAALRREDYDASAGELRVRGKGNVERAVPLAAGAQGALTAWLERRGDAPGPLFHAVAKGGHVTPEGLTGQSVLEALARLARRAGVAAFSPHDMRRTFISDLLDAGADIATVQQLAGHAQVTTTARYDRRGAHAKRRAADLLHVPFDRHGVPCTKD